MWLQPMVLSMDQEEPTQFSKLQKKILMQDDFFEATIDRKKHAKPKTYTSKFYFNFRKRKKKISCLKKEHWWQLKFMHSRIDMT